MKNTKVFTTTGIVVLLFGICAFIFNVIHINKTKTINTATTTQTTNITVYESQEYQTDGNACFRTSFIKTTEKKDGVLVGEYQENVFSCFCAGDKKALDGFEFKTTESVAGPNCEKQCAELCLNRK